VEEPVTKSLVAAWFGGHRDGFGADYANWKLLLDAASK
jgi:hypothetical protein